MAFTTLISSDTVRSIPRLQTETNIDTFSEKDISTMKMEPPLNGIFSKHMADLQYVKGMLFTDHYHSIDFWYANSALITKNEWLIKLNWTKNRR